MGKVALFAKPKFDPAVPTCPWFPTDRELQFGEISRHIDNSTREKVDLLGSVLGLTYLTELCVDCALSEIIKLCERPDVYAVLDAYQQGKAAVTSIRPEHSNPKGAL
jgi:hypothetical protein